MLGIIAGNMLPVNVVSALSVALYGMFIATVIPAARKDKIVLGVVIAAFLLSWVSAYLPVLCTMGEGTKTIVLTVVISAAAAVLFPREEEEEQ
ncbi:MAG: hypothetical protein IIV99_00785 [Oscillospiraceae bacterium]|nr:hypothetical protein [Oscillospiraceae bacterium]